jgi:D-alanyl-D-alanine carboxypeptidase
VYLEEKYTYLKKDKNLNKFIPYYGKRIHKVREIASLTKIITSMTTLDFMEKHNLDPDKVFYEIRKSSTRIGGTNAKL